jgi:hypothetical protein
MNDCLDQLLCWPMPSLLLLTTSCKLLQDRQSLQRWLNCLTAEPAASHVWLLFFSTWRNRTAVKKRLTYVHRHKHLRLIRKLQLASVVMPSVKPHAGL